VQTKWNKKQKMRAEEKSEKSKEVTRRRTPSRVYDYDTNSSILIFNNVCIKHTANQKTK
jgi:hypothetical protein